MALIIHNKAFSEKPGSLNCNELIDKSIKSGIVDDFIIIVPTGKLTRYLKYKIIENFYKINKIPCGDLQIHNLGKFAELCFRGTFPDNKYKILSESYRMAITDDAIKNADLEFYGGKGKKLNYHILEKLSNIIYGLREDGISQQMMLAEISEIELGKSKVKDKKKFFDIAKILVEYEKLLGDKYLDPPALLNLINNFADDYMLKNSTLNGSAFDLCINSPKNISQILIYGFSDFKNPEVRFLSKFASSNIPVAIHLEFSEINGPLFGNLREMKQTLIEAGFVFFYTDDESVNVSTGTPDITEYSKDYKFFLRRWLFNVEREIKYSGLSDKCTIFEFETIEQEISSICKLIKYKISSEGYKPSDISIVTRDSNIYSQLLRERFYLEKIPANFSERFNLSESQVVISIIACLDTIAGNYKRSDVIKVLENQFAKIRNSLNNPVDVSNLIQVSNELKFPKKNYSLSKDYWINRIKNSITYLKNSIANIVPESSADIDSQNMIKRLNKYETALIDFQAFADALPQKQQYYTPDEYKHLIINDIILKFDIHQTIRDLYQNTYKLYNNNSKYIYDKNIESIEKFSRALSEFLRILDEMIYILKDRSNNKMTLIELIEQLKLSVSSSKYQTREKLNYGVTVTVVEQIREIPFKITILCGLNDGIFPMPYRPESFLGKELHDSEERHLHSEQIQFYQYLINGADEIPHNEKQIFLTYSKFSNQYETARSTFIDSLLKVTNLENMSCLVQVNNENSDLIQKYPWLFSTSNRPEIAEYFAGQKAANADENIIVDSSNNELEQIKLYINELSVRYQDISNNNLAYLDDFSKKYLKNISTKVFSASEFETYSKCSYKYFAQKVLRLKEKESESNIIEPADFGNIMHSALYKFYLKLQKQSNEEWLQTNTLDGYELPLLKPVNINKFNKNDLVLLLMETISAEFEDVKFAHPYILLSKREILGNNEIIGWAEKFIDSEYDRVNTFNSYPSLFELEFGFGNGPNKIPAINIGYDIKLRGKIDRIEFSQNTSVASSNDLLFTTVDYKSSTSGTSTNKDIQNGFSFQMPLYSLAISKIITEFYGLNADLKAAAYYILKPKIAKDKKDDTKLTLFPINYSINTDNKNIKYLNDVAEQIELLDNSLNNAKEIIENIVLAKFSANPRNVNICKYCDFLAVCRKNERSILLVDDDDDDLISNSDDNV